MRVSYDLHLHLFDAFIVNYERNDLIALHESLTMNKGWLELESDPGKRVIAKFLVYVCV